MILILATAQAADLDLNDFAYVTDSDVARHMVLTPGPAPLLEAFEVQWGSVVGELEMALTNTGGEVLMVDWTQSAFVTSGGRSVRVLPGSAQNRDVGRAIPPMVVPPFAHVAEFIFRQDAREAADEVGERSTLAISEDIGEEISLTLAVDVGPERVWHTQPFSVAMDWEGLVDLEIERARSSGSTLRTWGMVFSVGGVGLGSIAALTAIDPESRSTGIASAVVLAGGGLLIGELFNGPARRRLSAAESLADAL